MLPVLILNDNILVHTTAVLLLLHTGTAQKKKPMEKIGNESLILMYKMLEDISWLSPTRYAC